MIRNLCIHFLHRFQYSYTLLQRWMEIEKEKNRRPTTPSNSTFLYNKVKGEYDNDNVLTIHISNLVSIQFIATWYRAFHLLLPLQMKTLPVFNFWRSSSSRHRQINTTKLFCCLQKKTSHMFDLLNSKEKKSRYDTLKSKRTTTQQRHFTQ